MADIAGETNYVDAATAVTQGKRFLLLCDYSSAVNALAQACELLADKHGDKADELGEPYLLYGRALLFLAREEAVVLGTGVPGNEESTVDDEDDDDDENDEDNDKEEEKTEDDSEARDVQSSKDVEKDKKKESEGEQSQEVEEGTVKEDEKKEDKKEVEAQPGSSKVDDSRPGTSKSDMANGESSKGNNEEDGEDVNGEDDEDEVHNLQVAWEVLELAKMVLVRRGPPGWKHLAEAHRLLGEVAMESGNSQGALIDLNACLDILNKITPQDPREIALTHYQLGLAYSLANEFDASIEQFNKATTLLETRIKELEAITEPPKSDDPFYTVEGEIEDLKKLLPEISEKISDMKEYKQEACRMIEGIKSKIASGSCSNGAGPSGSSTSTSPSPTKPASDISHLVRKKRKAEEPEVAAPPSKKPSP